MYKAQLTQTPQLTQKMSITPRLQQALKVLNMPLQELTQFITQELEQNPLLEFEEEETAFPHEELDSTLEWSEPETNIDQEDTAVDIDWETVFEDRGSLSERVNFRHSDADELPSDVPEERLLHEHLAEQLQLAYPHIITSETERAIGECILGNLNDDGQLELKLFQIPCEFVTELDNGYLSTELHSVIQKNLQMVTNDNDSQFSKTATITEKKIACPAAENDGGCIELAWKITDEDNKKTYTILYEKLPRSDRLVLNFYQLTLEDIADEVGCDTALVEAVLRKIQDTFEPLGIAYRDVQEALLIQIRNLNGDVREIGQENGSYLLSGAEREAPDFFRENRPTCHLAQEIVENQFNAFLNQKWDSIAEALKVDIADIDAAIQWIRTLSPYPGRYFTDPTTLTLKKGPRAQAVTPDVEIQYINGRYQAVSVDSYIPRLQINPYYLNIMQNHQDTLDPEAKEWIEKRYRDATNLLSSLAQRGSTIARVTEVIFEIQTEFLTQGVKGIKPLTLKTIAKKLGIHESTVSRVTSNKYVQTPHGMYPLRYFFSNELSTTQGEGVSAKQVKSLIQEMIVNEAPVKPLSDQAISNSLQAKGIRVARRTIQKYRDELGIPTSRERYSIRGNSQAERP
ncbi:MAG: RNA polymerase factor sigma-54 [Candidatus Poribacteria bacterium]|nr:RNA polymerase factor sigma-54 [Candidatus Poribacteria bacterium]